MGDSPIFPDKNLHYASRDKNVWLYKGECIDFLKNLPDNSVDILITDPAYSGMNRKMKFGNGRIVGEYQKEGNGKWFKEFEDTEENYRKFLKECKRVLKKYSHIYIMFDSFSLITLGSLLREYFDVKNIIVWDKVNMGMGHYFRRQHEFVIFSTLGNKKLNFKNLPDVWRFKRILGSVYPTQKPVELFEAMLVGSVLKNKEFVVCDPFMGSGSSGIAALKKGCIFLGADIDEKACDISKERLRHYLNYKKDKFQQRELNVDGNKTFWR